MKDRIKYVRAHTGLNQTDFGEKLHVSKSAVQKWESGENVPTDAVIELMSQKAGVNETWLRTGVGDPFLPSVREQEIAALTKTLMSGRSESFRSRLVTALLKFPPDAPEWEALERIYDSIEAELKKD